MRDRGARLVRFWGGPFSGVQAADFSLFLLKVGSSDRKEALMWLAEGC